jgi:hypothetical protein
MTPIGKLYLMSISEDAEPLITPEIINWPNDNNRPKFMEIVGATSNQNAWMGY